MPQDKKIAFGVNLFGKSIRSDLCIESLVKLKEKVDGSLVKRGDKRST